jgi:hypothetical protein
MTDSVFPHGVGNAPQKDRQGRTHQRSKSFHAADDGRFRPDATGKRGRRRTTMCLQTFAGRLARPQRRTLPSALAGRTFSSGRFWREFIQGALLLQLDWARRWAYGSSDWTHAGRLRELDSSFLLHRASTSEPMKSGFGDTTNSLAPAIVRRLAFLTCGP